MNVSDSFCARGRRLTLYGAEEACFAFLGQPQENSALLEKLSQSYHVSHLGYITMADASMENILMVYDVNGKRKRGRQHIRWIGSLLTATKKKKHLRF